MTPTPVALSLSLCDYVIIEEGTGKASLIGCFGQSQRQDPSVPRDFVVVAELADDSGPGRVEFAITRPDTDERIESKFADVYFRDRFRVVRYVTRALNCSFPVPGRYAIMVYVDGDLVAQRTLDVTFGRSEL